MKWWQDGRVWMCIWLVFFAGMVAWSVLTVMFWMDSTKNINALSIVANLGMALAGLQASLSMRKADKDDRF